MLSPSLKSALLTTSQSPLLFLAIPVVEEGQFYELSVAQLKKDLWLYS